MIINMGPQHPSTHGVLRLMMELDGETVLRVKPVIGYLHTGMEKTGEELTYVQGGTNVTRMDYAVAVRRTSSSTAWRSSSCSTSRCPSARGLDPHDDVRAQPHVVAPAVPGHQRHGPRRSVDDDLRLARARGGAAPARDDHRAADEPQLHPPRRRRGRPARRLAGRALRRSATSSKRGVSRVRRAAPRQPDLASSARSAWASSPPRRRSRSAITGPILRSTGFAWDLRKAQPYLAYDDVDFDVVYTEQRRRLRPLPHPALRDPRVDARSCASASSGCRGRLPRRRTTRSRRRRVPVSTSRWKRSSTTSSCSPRASRCPPGETYVAVESPRGEIGCYIVADGSGKPVRMHIRGPSLLQPAGDRRDDGRAGSSPTRSRSSRASTRSWGRSTGEWPFTPDEPSTARTRDHRAVPAQQVGDRCRSRTSRRTRTAGCHDRGDRRDRRARSTSRPRSCSAPCSFYTMFKREPVRPADRVGVHERDVPRDRRPGAARAPRARVRGRPRRHGRRGRVHRRVRPRARDPGQLRVPRATLTREAAEAIVERVQRGRTRAPRAISGQRERCLTSSAAETTRIVTKRLRDRPDDSWTIDARRSRPAATTRCARSLAQDARATSRTAGDASGLRGRGGAGFGTGQKWSFLPKDVFPRVPRGQRRRGRAVDVQGPHAPRARSAPADRGHRHLGVRDPGAPRLRLPARRVRARRRAARRRRSTRRTRRASSARTSSAPASTSRSCVHRGAGCYIAATRPACSSSLEGERGMPRIKPPFPAVAGPLRAADGRQQRRDALDGAAHRAERRRVVRGDRRQPLDGHAHLLGVGSRRAPGQLRGRARDARSATSSTASPAASATARSSKFFIPGGASSPVAPRTTSTSTRPRHGLRAAARSKTMLGSGAIMVFDETVDPLLVAWRLAKFFAHESCGKCTPCREGSGWIEKVLYRMVERPRPPRRPRPAARRSATTIVARARPRRSRRRRSARSARARCRRSSASTGSSATRSSRARPGDAADDRR